jgi:hypothetical protein
MIAIQLDTLAIVATAGGAAIPVSLGISGAAVGNSAVATYNDPSNVNKTSLGASAVGAIPAWYVSIPAALFDIVINLFPELVPETPPASNLEMKKCP